MPENVLPEPRHIAYDPSRSERLTVFYIKAEGDGSNFHSVVWEHEVTGRWEPRLRITREQFQQDHERRRWISDVHSIDPQRGRAVLMVAEGDKPEGSFLVNFIYSWRTWDLLNNREIDKIKICKDPFDRLE